MKMEQKCRNRIWYVSRKPIIINRDGFQLLAISSNIWSVYFVVLYIVSQRVLFGKFLLHFVWPYKIEHSHDTRRSSTIHPSPFSFCIEYPSLMIQCNPFQLNNLKSKIFVCSRCTLQWCISKVENYTVIWDGDDDFWGDADEAAPALPVDKFKCSLFWSSSSSSPASWTKP